MSTSTLPARAPARATQVLPGPMSFPEQARGLLAHLPADLDWLVAFDVQALLGVADETVLRAAWFVPTEVVLATARVIVLSVRGHALYGPGAVRPDWTDTQDWPDGDAVSGSESLAQRFRDHLDALGPESDLADEICLGLGHLPGHAPVAMNVRQRAGIGLASAVLAARPPMRDYALLAGCGVRALGVRAVGDFHVATFENRLSAHLTAALASAFARTHNCNLFFLRGLALDDALRDGLIEAGRGRIAVGTAYARAQVQALALAARGHGATMTALDAAPATTYPLGDLVPLGLLLHALRRVGSSAPAEAARTLLERHLDRHSVDGLWPFAAGRLATATDSALVLLGRDDAASVERLEAFADGAGGYVPQLSSPNPRPGHMLAEAESEHWRQADLGTTCLVRALRARAGLPECTSLAYLRTRFTTRSALFFANPFLVDWIVALALAHDPEADDLRRGLADEIAASADARHGFGAWDQGLSTACAILALAACGRRGRLMHCAQLRLLDLVDATGQPEASRPFYSTLRLPSGTPHGLVPDQPGLLRLGTQCHSLTLYEDSQRVVGAALRLLALAEPCDPALNDLGGPDDPGDRPARARHARYEAPDIATYLRDHALPPYLGDIGSARSVA